MYYFHYTDWQRRDHECCLVLFAEGGPGPGWGPSRKRRTFCSMSMTVLTKTEMCAFKCVRVKVSTLTQKEGQEGQEGGTAGWGTVSERRIISVCVGIVANYCIRGQLHQHREEKEKIKLKLKKWSSKNTHRPVKLLTSNYFIHKGAATRNGAFSEC